LGLTFKPNTDDMREAPSLAILPRLIAAGATIRAFDPAGAAEAKKSTCLSSSIVPTPITAIADAKAPVLLTEWNEFRAFDLARVARLLKRPLVVDLRNVYRPAEMEAAGLSYFSIGRPARPALRAFTGNPSW
jgi:UDPglucose 6-dehydrogenase